MVESKNDGSKLKCDMFYSCHVMSVRFHEYTLDCCVLSKNFTLNSRVKSFVFADTFSTQL